MRTFLLLLLVACGDSTPAAPDATPDAATPDAPPVDPRYDLSCATVPWPTTAPDPITLSGTVGDFSTALGTGVAGALVESIRPSDDTVVGSATTDAMARYTLTLATGGQAIERYTRITRDGQVTSYEYPPFALFRDFQGIYLWTMPPAGRDSMAAMAQVTLDPTKGIVGIEIADCIGLSIAGATVTSPSGTVVYNDDRGFPDPSLTATSVSGQVMIWNVDPGPIDVDITYGGTFRQRTIKSFADSFVWSTRHP